ncbi:MAG: OmpA/MotB family protein [Elusimicrobiales bacterium]
MAVRAKNMIPEDDPRVASIGHPAPPWLVNYADLMTEMVCFFIILYALSAALNKNVQNAAYEIKQMMEKGEMAGKVEINREGLRITLEEQGNLPFFESGKADITDEMIEVIDKIFPSLKKLSQDYEIIVEGHTDNVPINTAQFASNWELSTARATTVVKYLIAKGINPSKISAIGYGEFRPVAPNDTPQNRQKNRRVVFFVKTLTGKVKDVVKEK